MCFVLVFFLSFLLHCYVIIFVECNEYTCHLKGFAVGSKCVVWTSLKWCDARILEISEKGTRVSTV